MFNVTESVIGNFYYFITKSLLFINLFLIAPIPYRISLVMRLRVSWIFLLKLLSKIGYLFLLVSFEKKSKSKWILDHISDANNNIVQITRQCRKLNVSILLNTTKKYCSIFNYLNTVKYLIQISVLTLLMSKACKYLSLSPENIRKPYDFLMFSGGRERMRWKQMD